MKSICIKTNNTDIIVYLLDRLENLNIDLAYFSNRKFKLYENIIIHSKIENLDFFYDKISSLLTDTIILFFEEKLLKRILEYNYFYFTASEKKKILSISRESLENDTISKKDNYYAIYYSILDYIKQNKSMILDGFVNFRLQNYMKNLDYMIDVSVNKFLIEKEYIEFVDLLKLYISINPSNSPLVHLIYHSCESILLDDKKNVIPIENNCLDAKYLSDISFSTNDYTLNTLLNLNPKKIIIHLMNNDENEFITTLKSVFETRVVLCHSCDLCCLYNKTHLYY